MNLSQHLEALLYTASRTFAAYADASKKLDGLTADRLKRSLIGQFQKIEDAGIALRNHQQEQLIDHLAKDDPEDYV